MGQAGTDAPLMGRQGSEPGGHSRKSQGLWAGTNADLAKPSPLLHVQLEDRVL